MALDALLRQYVSAGTGLAFVAGAAAGYGVHRWANRLVAAFRAELQAAGESPGEPAPGPPVSVVAVATGLLFSTFFWLVFGLGAHSVHEVRPDPEWFVGRAAGHLLLLALLVTATLTDLREYVVPDAVTGPGVLAGVLLATLSGDTQLMHLWVDWNQAVPGLRGPWIPGWIAEHVYWHGAAWSLCGAAAGAVPILLVRRASHVALGQEALGLGDATLMAMTGSFLGWQATLFVLGLAPLLALTAGVPVRLLARRSFISFGPWLSLAAVVVLFSWRWLWELEWGSTVSIRRFFGDAVALGVLAGAAVALLIVLLGLLCLYRMIPGRNREPGGR